MKVSFPCEVLSTIPYTHLYTCTCVCVCVCVCVCIVEGWLTYVGDVEWWRNDSESGVGWVGVHAPDIFSAYHPVPIPVYHQYTEHMCVCMVDRDTGGR